MELRLGWDLGRRGKPRGASRRHFPPCGSPHQAENDRKNTPQQLVKAPAGNGQHRVDRVAEPTLQEATAHAMVELQMPDECFDGTPSPSIRLAQMRALRTAAIPTMARADPVLPGLTDDETTLQNLCSALQDVGVDSLATGILFLCSPIAQSLRKNVVDQLKEYPLLTPLRIQRQRNCWNRPSAAQHKHKH